MAEKDIAEKTLEAYNDVFADIANVLMFGGEPVIQPDELEDAAPRSAYKADGKVREIERDVVKRWTCSSIRIACLGMENQTDADADMPLRVFAYDGAEYRAQLNSGGGERYPVITLVLYFGYEKHWNQPVTLYEAARVSERLRPFVPDMKLNLYEIAYLSREQVRLFKSDFKIVADFFVQMRENGNYIPSPEKIQHVQETLRLLNVMTRDERFEEAYNRVEKGEVQTMCDVLDKVEKRGFDKGVLAGEARGEAKMEAILLNAMIDLVGQGKLTVSEAAAHSQMSLDEFEQKTGLKSLPS